MSTPYSISLKTVVEELNLTPVFLTEDYRSIQVTSGDVSRPGLPLTGFYDYFDNTRVQVMGKLESTYLRDLDPEWRQASIDRYMAMGIRFLILAHGVPVIPEILNCAKKYNVCLFTTDTATCDFMAQLIISLNQWLAPRTTLHGVLMEIHGEGVLITGESGVGKSEAALELVKRGHRLVADDAVDIRRVSETRLVGRAPEMVRNFMEIRGVGIIDIATMYGVGAIIRSKSIDFEVHLEMWQDGKAYDRMGLTDNYTEILGVKIPQLILPLQPGRNVAAVLEVAASNFRLKQMGYNAAEVLTQRHIQRAMRSDEEE